MKSTFVSVVVPTYRRPELLERCLNALLAQNFPAHAFEIIVVEDEPGETATQQMMLELKQRLEQQFMMPKEIPIATPIAVSGYPEINTEEPGKPGWSLVPPAPRLIYRQVAINSGPAGARNLGWQAAIGEIIAFTDDDCLPHPDWLANGVSAFQPGKAGVSGRVIVPLPPSPTDHEINTTGLERSDFVTANCFYRKSILETIGGFDERFQMAWREDSDLFFQLLSKHLPLAWAEKAVVIHPVRPERWGSSLRQQRKSFYNALLYKKHPQCYRQYIQKSPPWQYYAILAASVTAALGAITHLTWLFLIGIILYLILVARFTLRRLNQTSHSFSHICEMGLTSLLIPFLSIYWRLRGALHWKVFFF